ncbi:MAG: Spy/CpxP family protein refolding chaperone [Zoogloeaceae bacterium]|nr:Spy/CpxP family protein refolding chaperone [Zoogloeaceae bacterium]
MMGPGMMMGPDIMGGWGVGGPWIADLGLSDTQKKKVDALAAEAQEASRADWQAMNEAHLRMQAALNGERTDRGTAMAAYRQMQEAMAHHLERNLDLREKLDAVLTDRQRDILQERRRQGCGMGMGPGMRPGGGMGR